MDALDVLYDLRLPYLPNEEEEVVPNEEEEVVPNEEEEVVPNEEEEIEDLSLQRSPVHLHITASSKPPRLTPGNKSEYLLHPSFVNASMALAPHDFDTKKCMCSISDSKSKH